MKDILKDFVAHTHSLGNIDLVKVIGTEELTKLETISADKTVIVYGETKTPYEELKGTYGLPNLNKLDLHLKNTEYKENANIEVVWEKRNGEDQPTKIHFENEAGDYTNDYKLMGERLINEKIKSSKFRGANWNVEFEPSMIGLQRLKSQAAANSEEVSFMVKTENDLLKIYFGDANTHEGNFVFQKDIEGKLRQSWSYPVSQFISVLSIDGDKVVKFSDDGVILITVDSGLVKYEYYIPALTK